MSDPGTPEADLARLEARMDRIEAQLTRLTSLLDQALPVAAVGIDVVDEAVRRAQDRGVDVDARLRRAVGLVEAITDPKVLDALERTLQAAPVLGEGAALAGKLPGYAGIAIDAFDEEVARLSAQGIDVDAAARNGLTILRAAGRFLGSDQGRAFIESGLLEPDTVHRITQLSKAVVVTLNEEPPLIGPWGSFVRTWDRRFMRFAGFSFALAWRVGALLGPEGRKAPAARD